MTMTRAPEPVPACTNHRHWRDRRAAAQWLILTPTPRLKQKLSDGKNRSIAPANTIRQQVAEFFVARQKRAPPTSLH